MNTKRVSIFLKTGFMMVIVAMSFGSQMAYARFSGNLKEVFVGSGKSSKGGAQLWSENCMKCHNVRPPSWYSDAEWEVTMQHMRVRANLTPKEQKKILEFLKSAS